MIITCAHQVFEPKLSIMVEVKLDHFQRGDATVVTWRRSTSEITTATGELPPPVQALAVLRCHFRMNTRASTCCISARFHLTQQSICSVPEQQTEMWNSCIVTLHEDKHQVPNECTPVQRVSSSGLTRQLLETWWKTVWNGALSQLTLPSASSGSQRRDTKCCSCSSWRRVRPSFDPETLLVR